jgi:hypothetical protein
LELRLADNLLQLEEELRNHTYRPGAYHACYIPGDELFAANRARALPMENRTRQFWGTLLLIARTFRERCRRRTVSWV